MANLVIQERKTPSSINNELSWEVFIEMAENPLLWKNSQRIIVFFGDEEAQPPTLNEEIVLESLITNNITLFVFTLEKHYEDYDDLGSVFSLEESNDLRNHTFISCQ